MSDIALNSTESTLGRMPSFASNRRSFLEMGAILFINMTCLFISYFDYQSSITAKAFKNAMVVGPRQEATLFGNRDKFDLIAIYDSSSSTFGSDTTPISVLLCLI